MNLLEIKTTAFNGNYRFIENKKTNLKYYLIQNLDRWIAIKNPYLALTLMY